MDEILAFFEKYKAFGGYLVAAAALIGPAIQFLLTRAREARHREFETYHKLIEELVGGNANGDTWLDRQAAIIYELRHFKRYYPVTDRILAHLDEYWEKPLLNAEIALTRKRTKRRWYNRS